MRRPHLDREAEKIMSHYSRLLNGQPMEAEKPKKEEKPEPKKDKGKKK